MHAVRETSLGYNRRLRAVIVATLVGNVLFAVADAFQEHHLLIGIMWALMVAGGLITIVTYWVAAYGFAIRNKRYWHAAVTGLCIVIVQVHVAIASAKVEVNMWYLIADAGGLAAIAIAFFIQREVGKGPRPSQPTAQPQRRLARRRAA